jgi:predicted GTPase
MAGAIALIDGDHHPDAVRDALARLADVRGAVFCGGEEKLAPEVLADPSAVYGVPVAAGPNRVAALRDLVARTRPSATVEAAGSLGPVVGAHAGPGAVGLFWWHDPD